MAASNTRECFTECVGQKIRGVLFDALPIGRADLARDKVSLVLNDGTALTIGVSSAGGFLVWWNDSAEEVSRAIAKEKTRLEDTTARLGELLTMAGAEGV
jgi:hypothetical protein